MRRFYYTIFSIIVLFLFVVSCVKEQPSGGSDDSNSEPLSGCVSFDIFDDCFGELDTKSSLTGSDIEYKKTGITLAAYCNGKRYAKQHYSSSLSSMPLSLEPGYTYNVYAFVNMGDMTSSIPASENSIKNVYYTIPSYTSGDNSVSALGIPMCGYLQLEVTTSTTGIHTIPVKRLLAKVTVNLTVNWPGKVTSAKVYNMNGKLRPFNGVLTVGQSKAGSSDDILSFQEIDGLTSGTSPTMTAVFYVPENRQGTISGIGSSSDKAPDMNETVNSKSDVLTYLETTVTGTGVYSGTMKYRSYLGSNKTTNFNLIRNYHYTWNITYNENGTVLDDWKHDGNLTISKYRFILYPSSASINAGATKSFTVRRYTDKYYPNGELKSTGTSYSSMNASDFTWSSSNATIATVNSEGKATGISGGGSSATTDIIATLKPSVDDYAYYTTTSASAQLTVNDVISYTLEFTYPGGTTSSNRANIYKGDVRTLIINKVKLVNGVPTESTPLDNSYLSWSSSSTTKVSVTQAGVITAKAVGTANITATLKSTEPDYSKFSSSNRKKTCYLNVVEGSGWDDDWDPGSDINL